ncbi:MAG TPA: cellulase family glycosylhydrolase [Gemmatimonadales bacterium]|nr:cellulase family glycosylhydrolase [Gemmatimonadales bacterium]
MERVRNALLLLLAGALWSVVMSAAAAAEGTATPDAVLPFREQSGQVVIEAEHFSVNITRDGKAWAARTSLPGYAGDAYMVAEPDDDDRDDMLLDKLLPGPASRNAELQYRVRFTTTGLYRVWLRQLVDDSRDNSVYVGIDGRSASSTDSLLFNTYSEWVWGQGLTAGPGATVFVTQPGEHTINVWLREDGFRFDRLVLTSSHQFRPDGVGPPESPRGGAPLSTATPSQTATAGLTPSATPVPSSPTSSPSATPSSSSTPTASVSPTSTATQVPPSAKATSTAAPATLTPVPSGFVTRNGARFELDGLPFRMVGANMYNAAGDPTIYECGAWMGNPDVELDDWFARARRDFDGQAIRFWAFQKHTAGGTNWTAFDRVMQLARKHGLKVIPVLENQWHHCTEGGEKRDTWYDGGYLQPYGSYPLDYRTYVGRVVSRYKDEPAIAAWMLMNEAESKTSGGVAMPEPLFTFASDMSAYVKSLDPNHLVTLGVMGGGQAGVAGANYERLHGLSTIDFAEYHDYNDNDYVLPPNLATALAKAQLLDKPIIVGEAGMTVCGPYEGWQQETVESRAAKFDLKMREFFLLGGDGYLIWHWHPRENCSHDFTTGDPLNEVLARY